MSQLVSRSPLIIVWNTNFPFWLKISMIQFPDKPSMWKSLFVMLGRIIISWSCKVSSTLTVSKQSSDITKVSQKFVSGGQPSLTTQVS